MTYQIIRDDAPVSPAVRPIERRGGETYIGGTTVLTRVVYDLHREGDSKSAIAALLHITHEQVEFAIRYEAKKAKRRDPVRRQLKANGRATKQRGYRCEKKIEGILSPFGFKRMVMSGALGGEHSGDLRRVPAVRCGRCGHAEGAHYTWQHPVRKDEVTRHCRGVLVADLRCHCEGFDRRACAVSVLEVKRRQDAQRFLRDALAQGGAHAVVVDPAGGQEPLFVMTLTTATHLLREAGYQVADAPISYGEPK